MKAFRFLILLIAISSLIITCSKDEEEEFNPDLTKNAIFISDGEYSLTQGFIACVWQKHPYDFMIQLFSSGLSHDTSEHFYGTFEGIGDFISLEITTDSWDGPDPGTYSTDVEDGEPGFMEAELALNLNAETFEASRVYELSSGTMILQKEGNEYEFTINGKCKEYDQVDDGEVIKEGINIALHYKGSLPEYNFLTEDPSE